MNIFKKLQKSYKILKKLMKNYNLIQIVVNQNYKKNQIKSSFVFFFFEIKFFINLEK